MSRYSTQISFLGWADDAEEKLPTSRVLVVGCGALGGLISNFLARAGVGNLILADDDRVELSNLTRQLLFDECDVSKLKVEAAKEALLRANSEVKVTALPLRVTASNIENLLDEHPVDLIADGTDNFPTRCLLNQVAVEKGIPFVFAGVDGSRGQILAVKPGGRGACLNCLLGDKSQTVPPKAVLGPTVGVIASLAAAQVLKILAGKLGEHSGGLLAVDVWTQEIRNLEAMRRDDCEVCGD